MREFNLLDKYGEVNYMEKVMQPNVLCGTSHNYFVKLAPGESRTFRVRMRVQRPGDKWRIGYSNTVDTTWDDGLVSYANMPGSAFEIVSAAFASVDGFSPVTFDGKASRMVAPREIILSDTCDAKAIDGYIEFRWCLRAGEQGAIIPATPDSQALCYYADGEHTADGADAFTDALTLEPQNLCVLPDLFEAEGAHLPRMVFIGDSITQGCGTRVDMYESWAARIAQALADRYASLNIGLGYAQIKDAASNGAWLARTKNADIVNVCLGVNDIFHGDGSADICIERLRSVIAAIKAAPKAPRVVIFTVPPFDYEGDYITNWRRINTAIKAPEHLGADAMFDMASVLSIGGDREYMSKYGPHPDGVGGAAVAREYVENFIDTLK